MKFYASPPKYDNPSHFLSITNPKWSTSINIMMNVKYNSTKANQQPYEVTETWSGVHKHVKFTTQLRKTKNYAKLLKHSVVYNK